MHSRVIPEPLSRDNLLSPHFTCSFFALLVPFFASKRNNPLTLACIFFIYLVSFLPITSLKKRHNPCFFLPSSVRALFCIIIFQFFSFMHIHLHAQKTVTPSIVELPFVLKYTSINLFVREEIQEYVYHFIMIRIVLAQNDAIEILYILFNIRICI